MATYALFYNDEDRAAVAKQMVRQDLPELLALKAALHWDGGFQNYRIAPGAPYARLEGDQNTTALEITAAGGLDSFVELLRGIADAFPNDPEALYMDDIATDIENPPYKSNSAAKEPWTGS